MGSLFGGGSAKRAAKAQAKATLDAARAATKSANYQAEAATNQISMSQEQRTQQAYAEDLLSTPMDSAEVDLAPDDGLEDDGDLLKRRRTSRQAYQNRSSGLSV